MSGLDIIEAAEDALDLTVEDISTREIKEAALAVLAAVTPLIEANALVKEREEIAGQARRYAGHYKEGSDGRNTFIMLAEWIEARK